MACNCGKSQDQAVYVVTLRTGETVEVTGERATRIKITQAGGGTYSKK